jgi:hypothetical protein
MKLEKLHDLLEMDTESLKVLELKRVLTRVKQLIKLEKVDEVVEELSSDHLPFIAVSAVGNKSVTLKFDIESKKAAITEVKEDTRGGHMAFYNAQMVFNDKVKKQTRKGN